MQRHKLGLSLLFFSSGCAALIYEVVWFQLLRLTIGSSALSVGLTVATFMAGMCLGSLYFHRFVPARIHPIKVYALLELGIACFGIINYAAIPRIGEIYFDLARHWAIRC